MAHEGGNNRTRVTTTGTNEHKCARTSKQTERGGHEQARNGRNSGRAYTCNPSGSGTSTSSHGSNSGGGSSGGCDAENKRARMNVHKMAGTVGAHIRATPVAPAPAAMAATAGAGAAAGAMPRTNEGASESGSSRSRSSRSNPHPLPPLYIYIAFF